MATRSNALPTELPAQCLNCGAPLGGRYCAQCGQDHRHIRLRVTDWIHDATDSVL
jgi:hypothetical protein